eukprot:gb/GEZN01010646.1/.p1 GENE.gb/GEZN01010646.1/~~gb/GEZN01010646.1/.p1  ORF type:complete len:345 (-),score=11.68 gb/GEZN01010646.1/:68-1102(-)
MKQFCSSQVGMTPLCVRWVPESARLCVMGVDSNERTSSGFIRIMEVASGGQLQLKACLRVGSALRCGIFQGLFPARDLTTGNFQGELEVWDVERLQQSYSVKATAPCEPVRKIADAHSSIINAVDGGWQAIDAGVGRGLASASRDGQVKLWDFRKPQALVTRIVGSVISPDPVDMWAVSLGRAATSTPYMLACGDENGLLRIFDVRVLKQTVATHCLDAGITSLSLGGVSTLGLPVLCVTTTSGTTGLLDLKAGSSIVWVHPADPGHTSWVAICSRNLLATSNSKGTVRTYLLEASAPPRITAKLLGRKVFNRDVGVISMDWHPDRYGLLATAALDSSISVLVV